MCLLQTFEISDEVLTALRIGLPREHHHVARQQAGRVCQPFVQVGVIPLQLGALQGGDKIEIRGFGSFRIRQRNPRIGRNPKTGERVEVPAKRVPYFKPSKELRDLVNPEEAAKSE